MPGLQVAALALHAIDLLRAAVVPLGDAPIPLRPSASLMFVALQQVAGDFVGGRSASSIRPRASTLTPAVDATLCVCVASEWFSSLVFVCSVSPSSIFLYNGLFIASVAAISGSIQGSPSGRAHKR